MIFEEQVEQWSRPPIGGANTSNGFLAYLSDEEVREWVEQTWPKQYAETQEAGHAPNWRGMYRRWLGLDDTHGKTVLDFGCGFGFDALSYMRMDNAVLLADIVPGNLLAATRVLLAHRYLPSEVIELNAVPGDFYCGGFDVFHAAGVLHHMPFADAQRVLQRARVFAADGAEARLMVYTDQLWFQATRQLLPEIATNQALHPCFMQFVRHCDAVGFHAEWYNEARIRLLVANTGWELKAFEYIREDNGYAVVILQKGWGE